MMMSVQILIVRCTLFCLFILRLNFSFRLFVLVLFTISFSFFQGAASVTLPIASSLAPSDRPRFLKVQNTHINNLHVPLLGAPKHMHPSHFRCLS